MGCKDCPEGEGKEGERGRMREGEKEREDQIHDTIHTR